MSVVGVTMIGSAVGCLVDVVRLHSDVAVETTGVVVDVISESCDPQTGCSYLTTVEYSASEEVFTKSMSLNRRYAPGDQISVVYLPDNPRVASHSPLGHVGSAALGLFSGTLLVGAVAFRIIRGRWLPDVRPPPRT